MVSNAMNPRLRGSNTNDSAWLRLFFEEWLALSGILFVFFFLLLKTLTKATGWGDKKIQTRKGYHLAEKKELKLNFYLITADIIILSVTKWNLLRTLPVQMSPFEFSIGTFFELWTLHFYAASVFNWRIATSFMKYLGIALSLLTFIVDSGFLWSQYSLLYSSCSETDLTYASVCQAKGLVFLVDMLNSIAFLLIFIETIHSALLL